MKLEKAPVNMNPKVLMHLVSFGSVSNRIMKSGDSPWQKHYQSGGVVHVM